MTRFALASSLSSLLAISLLAPGAHGAEPGDLCTQDSDCGEGMWCEGGVYDREGAGEDSGEGSGGGPAADVGTSGEELIEDGQCVRSPVICSVSEDCPEASQCSGGFCTFPITLCTDHAECDDGFVCTSSGEVESCASEPCRMGEECSNEVVCETEASLSFCFPAPVACTEAEGCEGDWTCYPADFEGGPESWVGIEQACLPLGVVGALEGWIVVEEFGDIDGAPAQRGGETVGAAGMGPVPETNEGAESVAGGDTTGAADGEKDDGGCSVTRANGAGSGLFGLLLLVGGVLLGRRRQRPVAAA